MHYSLSFERWLITVCHYLMVPVARYCTECPTPTSLFNIHNNPIIITNLQMRKLSSVGVRHQPRSLRCQSIWSFCLPLPSKELRLTDIFSLAWVYNQLWKFCLKNSLPLSEKDLLVIPLKFQPVCQIWRQFPPWSPAIPAPGTLGDALM